MGILKEVQDENARLKEEWLNEHNMPASKVEALEFARGVKEVLHNVKSNNFSNGFMFKVLIKGNNAGK